MLDCPEEGHGAADAAGQSARRPLRVLADLHGQAESRHDIGPSHEAEEMTIQFAALSGLEMGIAAGE